MFPNVCLCTSSDNFPCYLFLISENCREIKIHIKTWPWCICGYFTVCKQGRQEFWKLWGLWSQHMHLFPEGCRLWDNSVVGEGRAGSWKLGKRWMRVSCPANEMGWIISAVFLSTFGCFCIANPTSTEVGTWRWCLVLTHPPRKVKIHFACVLQSVCFPS